MWVDRDGNGQVGDRLGLDPAPRPGAQGCPRVDQRQQERDRRDPQHLRRAPVRPGLPTCRCRSCHRRPVPALRGRPDLCQLLARRPRSGATVRSSRSTSPRARTPASSACPPPASRPWGRPAGVRATFAGGRIYSIAATGAHEVHGRVLTIYLNKGGADRRAGVPDDGRDQAARRRPEVDVPARDDHVSEQRRGSCTTAFSSPPRGGLGDPRGSSTLRLEAPSAVRSASIQSERQGRTPGPGSIPRWGTSAGSPRPRRPRRRAVGGCP